MRQFALLLAILVSSSVANAQQTVEVKKLACWPPIFDEGNKPCNNKTAIATAKESVQTIVQKVGLEWVDEGRINGALKQLGLGESNRDNPTLPKPEEMLKLGKAIGVDYVLAYRCSWRTKSVWVALGPKTKAYCRTVLVLVNVAKGEIEYNPEPFEADSTKKESGAETAASLLVSFGFTALSGGPKTPHMQRSAQLSIAETLEAWVKPRLPQGSRKIKQ